MQKQIKNKNKTKQIKNKEKNKKTKKWSYSVMVSTEAFEASNLSSSLGKTYINSCILVVRMLVL